MPTVFESKIAKEQGLGWVVSGHQIAYVKPARLMETVVIDSSYARTRAVSRRRAVSG